LKVERRVTDRHDFRHVIYARGFHGVKEHERSRPALRNIIAADAGDEIFLPSQALKYWDGNLPIETRGCSHKITA
jgi:hypothetical protein